MNLRIFESTADLVSGAARTIEQRVAGAERASIAISGGSTPRPLYELLATSPHRETLAKTAITWIVVDERYVPVTDPQSNEAMIRKTLFRESISPPAFLPFDTSFADPAKSADDFAAKLAPLLPLDIAILGMGDDGHTASLFPGTTALDEQERNAAAVFVPRLDRWRVTLTLPVIRAAKLRIVLVAGESKAGILAELQQGADYPIARATSGEIETWWFLDAAAAAELDRMPPRAG